ncbi:MAG: hypothetical protein Q9227_003988 [Pyrenula ochraceoflavens]
MAGGGVGNEGQPNHSAGTEYTLQGVMRFLQTEWHRHERDRNAWEIERAEMKSRIGRLEGDARKSKKIQESLGKHVKILEIALKKERERVRSLSNGEKVDVQKDPKEIARESLKNLPKPLLTNPGKSLENEGSEDELEPLSLQQEAEREKSRSYLSKCAQEVTYHVVPSAHPPPQLSDLELPNHVLTNQSAGPPSLQEAYAQQRQNQQHMNNMSMVRETPLTNHQQAPILPPSSEPHGLARSATQINHAAQPPPEYPVRRSMEPTQTPVTAIDNRKPLFETPAPDEQVESISHSFDVHGRQVSPREERGPTRNVDEVQVDAADGWDFDDSTHAKAVQTETPQTATPHRPDTVAFPNTDIVQAKSPPVPPGSHRRKSSGARKRSEGANESSLASQRGEASSFKVRFALRGHLDVVRSVIFTGGGTPAEPEICTCSDDSTLKRWIIPASYGGYGSHPAVGGNDLDITSYFTHRGHSGSVTSLAACPASQNFSNGGRALGDGWVFSGGQDHSVRVWERGRVDPKATLQGHTDAVWALCVLPGSSASCFGERSSSFGGSDRILLASGGADGRILIWAVSSPPQLNSPHAGSNRGSRGSRRANSVSSGSNFPSSPQPSTATSTPFHYTLVHNIVRADTPSPTCISSLSPLGDTFVVSYTDASILVFDTRSGEEVVGMASLETYDNTPSTGVNAVVASTIGFDGTASLDPNRGVAEDDNIVHGATGSSGGVEGMVISGHEDRYIRLFDANSGQCTYTMLAHPSAISSLSLSPDGRELVSAGHDASLRFWSLEKRSCTQEITSHRLMRGEGVCSVVWSQDGRWVVSGGGDGVVKVFAR